MSLKLTGPALCGFADFFDEYDTGSHVNPIVGVARQAGHFVQKTTATGKPYTALVVKSSKPTASAQSHTHKTSIANARKAGKRAQSSGKALLKALQKGSTRVKVAPEAVHGVHGEVVLGAVVHPVLARSGSRGYAAPVTRGSAEARRQAHFTAAQLHKIAQSAVHAGQLSTKGADQHETFIKGITDAQKAGVKNLQSKLSPTSTSITGDYGKPRKLREIATLLGQDAGAAPTPDQGQSSTDQAAAAAGPLDPSMDPAQNYGIGTPPTSPPPLQPGIDYAPDPTPDGKDQAVYSGLPNGAVVFDGTTHPPGHMDIGSYVAFYGPLTGASENRGEGVGPDRPGADAPFQGGYRLHNDGWWYNWNGDNQKGSDVGNLQLMGSGPHHWGPLVGNPNGSLPFLRYDIKGNQFFWFRDKAPQWATASDDQARLNQAILDYKAQYAAAASNAAQQAAQDLLDQKTAADLKKQQDKEDEAHQRDLAKQAQADELAQAQQATQQAAFDQQMAQQQAQADLEQQKAEAQMSIQERQAALQAPPPDQGAYDQGTYDQGGGDQGAYDQGGGAPPDETDESPEAASDEEAQAIDQQAMMGSIEPVNQYLRRQQMMDEMAVDGSGQVIGIDEWGNVTD